MEKHKQTMKKIKKQKSPSFTAFLQEIPVEPMWHY